MYRTGKKNLATKKYNGEFWKIKSHQITGGDFPLLRNQIFWWSNPVRRY